MNWGLEDIHGRIFILEAGRTHTVGRDGLNHLVLRHGSAANRHAELRATSVGVEVRDSVLKPVTMVDGVRLDGGCSLASLDETIRFGREEFRVVKTSRTPEDRWDLGAAMARLEKGQGSKLAFHVWTRWWRGFDWRPIAGQFGVRGASFWLRVFHECDKSWAAYERIVSIMESMPVPDAPLEAEEVETILDEVKYRDRYGMVAYLAQEIVGHKRTLEWLTCRRGEIELEMLDWLAPFEPDSEALARTRGWDAESKFAYLSLMYGLETAASMVVAEHPNAWVLWWAVQRGASDEVQYRLALAGHGVRTDFLERFSEVATDEAWRNVVETTLDSGHRTYAEALARRPIASLVGRFVGEASAASWDIGRWLAGLGPDAAPGLNRIWRTAGEYESDRMVECVAMMPDDALQTVWGHLDPAICARVMERFGPFIARVGVSAPIDEVPPILRELSVLTTVPNRHFKFRDDVEWRDVDLSQAPAVWTTNGRVVPLEVVRGYVAALVTRHSFRGNPDDWALPEYARDERWRPEPEFDEDNCDWHIPYEWKEYRPDPRFENDFERDYASHQVWPARQAWMSLVEPRSSLRLWLYLESLRPTLMTWSPSMWPENFLDEATVARELLARPYDQRSWLRTASHDAAAASLIEWWVAHAGCSSIDDGREELEENLPTVLPLEAQPMADAWIASYIDKPKAFRLDVVRTWRVRPWLARTTSKVVWQSEKDGEPVYFWWDPDGDMVDAHEEPVWLALDAMVWVTRGDTMSDECRGAWARLFSDYELIQAQDQLVASSGPTDLGQFIGQPVKWHELGDDWEYDFQFEKEHYADDEVTVYRRDFGLWGGVRVVVEGNYSHAGRRIVGFDFYRSEDESIPLEEAQTFIVQRTWAEMRRIGT